MRPWASCHVQLPLRVFEHLSTEAGSFSSPAEVAWDTAGEMSVPGTMFGELGARGRLDLAQPPDLESEDFWLRACLPDKLADAPHRLVFEGLAGIVDVWVSGEHRLRAENMFRSYELALDDLRAGDELVLRFASLNRHLAGKRARPRFRTRLVESQQLRWIRTSLLGRTPGFSPRIPALGPYRRITLEAQPVLRVLKYALSTRVRAGRAQVSLSLSLELTTERDAAVSARLVLEGSAANGHFPMTVQREGTRLHLRGQFDVSDAALWWPHTHGPQPLSLVEVELSGLRHSGAPVTLSFGRVGFRELALDRGREGTDFRLLVNQQPVFCRGACWTINDLLTLSDDNLLETLTLARDAGMNMLRVGGTMLYESDAFYDACDALGILVFQDFMFANMDYPIGDAEFEGEVRAEVSYQLGRFAGRPSLAVLCGGSEVEQQVAMLGLARELGQSSLFYQLLPALAAQHLPEVPYVPNSPSGGTLPFQVDAGVTHYYGVGAYLRPLHDARVSRVRFASECLAFANVPSPDAVEDLLKELEMPFHHPRWKERVPRDRGAGWDFEDVRDHYLELLYHESARSLRYADPERYLRLSRAVVVDVMEAVVAELRRTGADCGGLLVWWLKDLWLGAGWGVLDARSVPKSAYYGLRRAFAARALLVTDEGMNGPALHVFNDRPEPLEATLLVSLLREGRTAVARAERQLQVAPHSAQELRADALFERFLDAGYVYRFGPANHDVLTAQLLDEGGETIARTALLIGSTAVRVSDVGLSASWAERAGKAGLLVRSQGFARRVEIELDQHDLVLDDNYFHLEPGSEHWVGTRPVAGKTPRASVSSGRIRSLNAATSVRFHAPGASA